MTDTCEHRWLLLTTVEYENSVFILSGAYKRRWGVENDNFCEYIRGCTRCFIIQGRIRSSNNWGDVAENHGQSLVDDQLKIQYNIRLRKFMRA